MIIVAMLAAVLCGLSFQSTSAAADTWSQCPQLLNATCFPDALPILKTLTQVPTPADCCGACLLLVPPDQACISWTHRASTSECYLRGSYTGNTKPGADCTSGRARAPPPPPPPPPLPPKGSPNILLMLVVSETFLAFYAILSRVAF